MAVTCTPCILAVIPDQQDHTILKKTPKTKQVCLFPLADDNSSWNTCSCSCAWQAQCNCYLPLFATQQLCTQASYSCHSTPGYGYRFADNSSFDRGNSAPSHTCSPTNTPNKLPTDKSVRTLRKYIQKVQLGGQWHFYRGFTSSFLWSAMGTLFVTVNTSLAGC